MSDAVQVGVFMIASAVLLASVPTVQWLGRWPRGHPDSPAQRTYLCLPWCAGLLIVGSAVLLASTVPAWMFLALLSSGGLVAAVGLVLLIWAPQRFRPRWQKEYMVEMGYGDPDRPRGRRLRRERR